jgi:hypothetical protein
MAEFEAAHIRQQGIDLIIVPLRSDFGRRTNEEQNDLARLLQEQAALAGLTGTVVPVWDGGGGRMAFLAPGNWHKFFESIGLGFVARNINRKIICR